MSQDDLDEVMPEEDPIQPDQITGPVQASEEVERYDAAARAVQAAAVTAMQEPGIPGRDEFLSMCLQARMLSMSQLAPESIRGRPYDALLLLWTARDLGIPATSAMRKISVIGGQPSLDTQLLCALVRRAGLGQVIPHPDNMNQEVPVYAKAIALGPDGTPMGPDVIYTWDDALAAGYVDPTCRPNEHNIRQMQRRNGGTYQGCGCKEGYRTSLRDMLYWRAASRACRFYFSEAGLGMYSPEEIANFTDDAGRMLDPTTVELPEGYDDPNAEKRERQAAAEAPADLDEQWELQVRIQALPEGLRDELRERWVSQQLPSVRAGKLPAGKLRTAKSMVNGFEAKAKSQKVDLEAQREFVIDELSECLTFTLAAGVSGAGERPSDSESASEAPDGDAPANGSEAATESHEGTSGETEAETPEPVAAVDRVAVGASDWKAELAILGTEVRDLAAGVDPTDIEAITQTVKSLHHAVLNRKLRENYGLEAPGSPIDYRQMLLSRELLRAKRAESPALARRDEEPF